MQGSTAADRGRADIVGHDDGTRLPRSQAKPSSMFWPSCCATATVLALLSTERYQYAAGDGENEARKSVQGPE